MRYTREDVDNLEFVETARKEEAKKRIKLIEAEDRRIVAADVTIWVLSIMILIVLIAASGKL